MAEVASSQYLYQILFGLFAQLGYIGQIVK